MYSVSIETPEALPKAASSQDMLLASEALQEQKTIEYYHSHSRITSLVALEDSNEVQDAVLSYISSKYNEMLSSVDTWEQKEYSRFTSTQIDIFPVEITTPSSSVLYADTKTKNKERANFASRITELRAIKDGWLDGEGLAPKSAILNWLSQDFASAYPQDLPLPYLYPTEEGGVEPEWSIKPWEITLEIEDEDCKAYWHEMNMKTHETTEKDLKLKVNEDWQWMIARIREKIKSET